MKNTDSIMKFAHAGIQGLDLVTGGSGCKSKKTKSKKTKSKKTKSCKSAKTASRTGSNGGNCYNPCA